MCILFVGRKLFFIGAIVTSCVFVFFGFLFGLASSIFVLGGLFCLAEVGFVSFSLFGRIDIPWVDLSRSLVPCGVWGFFGFLTFAAAGFARLLGLGLARIARVGCTFGVLLGLGLFGSRLFRSGFLGGRLRSRRFVGLARMCRVPCVCFVDFALVWRGGLFPRGFSCGVCRLFGLWLLGGGFLACGFVCLA